MILLLEYRLHENVSHGSSEFPFAVYDVNYETGSQSILPLHWHEEIECIIIHRGQAVFSINHTDFKVTAGDCLIINSGEVHSGYSHAPEGCAYSAILFKLSWLSALHPDLCQEQYLNPILRGELLFPALLESVRAQHLPIIGRIGDLLTEYHGSQAAFELGLKGRLYLILTALHDHMIPKERYERSRLLTTNKWKNLMQVLEYIDENYKSPLTLEELASIGTISTSHLCRRFKEMTGVRPLEYVNLLRINSAALMLQAGSCNVLEAAMDNGFQHLSYFSKQFKKYKGRLPSEWKKDMANRHIPD